jgi:sec-independent protein translocase protein TatA
MRIMLSGSFFATLGPGFCFFGPIGWQELLIIMFLVLLFFGPKRLPEMAEALGKSIQKFKKASRDMGDEIESASTKKPDEITEGKDKQG